MTMQKVKNTIESFSQSTTLKIGFIISLMIGLTMSLALWATNAQAQTVEGQEYIVQADDWLSKIAAKFYGDALAYPTIVEATNAQATEDGSFAVIDNPDVIEVGQKLFIPSPDGPAISPANVSVVGIYKVMLPGASSPGLDTTLYLNADNTLRQVSDYLNGEPPIEEVGTWQRNGDQVVLTVTGQVGQPYDQASSQTLLLTDEGLMTVSAGVGSGYWTLQPFTALALAEATVPYDTAEAAQSFSDDGFIGFYKGFLPAASCCGQDITLSLNFDNTASLTTDYLNGEAPIVQTGSWTTTTESSVAVSLDRTEASLALVVSDGLLVTPPEETTYGSSGLQLYRFPVIAINSLTVNLTGTVGYLQDTTLPPQAVLTVQLVDVSKADAPAEIIAEQVIPTEGQQPPFNFALPYHPLKIRSNLTYAVQARIEVDGELLFITTTRYPALSQDAPETVEVIVEPVAN